MLLLIYSMVTIPDDTVEFTGELIDKYIDQRTMDTCFVVKNNTIERANVDINFYYSHEIGDIVTVECLAPGEIGDQFFFYMVFTGGFVTSVFLLMFIDYHFHEKLWSKQNEEKQSRW